MDTKFPNLLAALDQAIAALPDNLALREHRNRLLSGLSQPAVFGRLRLVTDRFEPPQDLAVAR